MTAQKTDERLLEPVTKFVRQDYVQILVHQTVGEALNYVQKSGIGNKIVYFYVLDEEGRLQGVVPTRRLLLSRPEVPVSDIMVTKMIALPSSATLVDACELFLFHRLLALPVVDEERHLVGIIDVELYNEELADLAEHNESDDIFQLIGVHLASVQKASTAVAFFKRFPWLLCNIGGGLCCAFLAGFYEQTLNQVIALAMFIPVVLALAESVSIQSLTLTLQAQHGRGFKLIELYRQLVKEIPVGILLGVACGGLVGLAAWLWQGMGLVGACILISIAISITLATLFGLLVPTLLRAVQRDPKVASGPITLAMTDLATLFCYFGLASMMFPPVGK
jgi:magnesium transporter